MALLVMLRHWESEYNRDWKFAGIHNPDLTQKWVAEAKQVGEKLKWIHFDIAFTSMLERAQRTQRLILSILWLSGIAREYSAMLNERNYGDLSGKRYVDIATEYWEEQVHKRRRAYDVPPPNGESLKDLEIRATAYFKERILAQLRQGKNVLLTTHSNTMRALIKDIEGISDEDIENIEFENGEVVLFDFDSIDNTLTRRK